MNPYETSNDETPVDHCPYCMDFDAGVAVMMALGAGVFGGFCLAIALFLIGAA